MQQQQQRRKSSMIIKQKIISSMPRAKAPASLEDSDKEGEDLHRNNIISFCTELETMKKMHYR